MMPVNKKIIGAGAAGSGLVGAILLALPYVSQFEGVWLKAKIDTIGTGKPLTWCFGETEGPVKLGQQFTLEQCKGMLAKKLPRYASEVAKCTKVEMPPKVGAAFISLAYNVGSGGVCKSTAMRKWNAGDKKGACEAFMSWTRAGGRVVQGLINRRKTERKLCLEGI